MKSAINQFYLLSWCEQVLRSCRQLWATVKSVHAAHLKEAELHRKPTTEQYLYRMTRLSSRPESRRETGAKVEAAPV